MSNTEVVMKIMFEYERLCEKEIQELIQELNVRIIRWMAMYHPTNWVRTLLYKFSGIDIGSDVVINPRLMVFDDYKSGLIKVADRVSIASDVTIIAISSPNNSELQNIPYVKNNLIKCTPVTINEDVWVGAKATILPGVTIGEKSIIGAGAVVVKSVPPKTVVVGVPATTVRTL